MLSLNSPHMHVVRKEEKEARLKDFIGRHAGCEGELSRIPQLLTVVARGFDSPVILALSTLSVQIAATGCSLRILIGLRDGAVMPEALAALPDTEIRSGCDVRLLDAHEQMLIGTCAVWIGDCMRREPAKRDAYECYSADCEQTAVFAQRAFNRLWKGASPLVVTKAVDTVALQDGDIIDPSLAALAEAPAASVVSTRH